jgi:hypothetical protein
MPHQPSSHLHMAAVPYGQGHELGHSGSESDESPYSLTSIFSTRGRPLIPLQGRV